MKANRRSELKQAYKQKEQRKGIYKVFCSQNNQIWVDSSVNIDSIKNRIWFNLRLGTHTNKQLQAVCKQHGLDSMAFEIIELVDAELSGYALDSTMKDRKAHWIEELNASSCM